MNITFQKITGVYLAYYHNTKPIGIGNTPHEAIASALLVLTQ